jgi:uncharacterized protein HemX
MYYEKTRRAGIAAILAIALFLIAGLGIGYYKVFYTNTVGTAQESAERNKILKNKSYTEGMISDLANYRLQYQKEKDETFKKALRETIITKYANFKTDLIDDPDLKQFLLDIRNGD